MKPYYWAVKFPSVSHDSFSELQQCTFHLKHAKDNTNRAPKLISGIVAIIDPVACLTLREALVAIMTSQLVSRHLTRVGTQLL